MYADFVGEASFWLKLKGIDLELSRRSIARGCQLCGGPLHVADYPRKPRGVPEAVDEAFSTRYSACCGHCRRRCTPPSVRFQGLQSSATLQQSAASSQSAPASKHPQKELVVSGS